jgi:hypothetical protein
MPIDADGKEQREGGVMETEAERNRRVGDRVFFGLLVGLVVMVVVMVAHSIG